MVKKFLIAGAGAATVFGLTAAGASSITFPGMGQGTNGSHVVQQSDRVGVTCTTGPVQMATNVTDDQLTSVYFAADDVLGCSGAEIQAVAYDANGVVLGKTTLLHGVGGTNRLGFPVLDKNGTGVTKGWGQQVEADFPAGILASQVDKVRLTIADYILG